MKISPHRPLGYHRNGVRNWAYYVVLQQSCWIGWPEVSYTTRLTTIMRVLAKLYYADATAIIFWRYEKRWNQSPAPRFESVKFASQDCAWYSFLGILPCMAVPLRFSHVMKLKIGPHLITGHAIWELPRLIRTLTGLSVKLSERVSCISAVISVSRADSYQGLPWVIVTMFCVWK